MPSVTIHNPYEQIEDPTPDKFAIYEKNDMPDKLQGSLFEIVSN